MVVEFLPSPGPPLDGETPVGLGAEPESLELLPGPEGPVGAAPAGPPAPVVLAALPTPGPPVEGGKRSEADDDSSGAPPPGGGLSCQARSR